MGNSDKISILGLWIVFSLVILYCYTYAHEDAHKQFAIHNGCKVYELNNGFFNPHFSCINYTEQKYPESEYILDSYNEIISYNFMWQWITSIAMGLLICVTIMYQKED